MFSIREPFHSQILAVAHEQIKGAEVRLRAVKEQVAELWPSPLIQAHNLSVEHGLSFVGQFRRDRLAKVRERIERMAVARDQLTATVLNNGEPPEAVVLQLEDPLGVVKRRRFAERPGRAAMSALDDERNRRRGLLSVHTLGLPHVRWALPKCEVYSGAGPGMEADAMITPVAMAG